jgi:hypothetical protein
MNIEPDGNIAHTLIRRVKRGEDSTRGKVLRAPGVLLYK